MLQYKIDLSSGTQFFSQQIEQLYALRIKYKRISELPSPNKVTGSSKPSTGLEHSFSISIAAT